MSKTCTLFIILILATSSMLLVESVTASVPAPAIPEFNVELVVHFYDVPQTSTITVDQYTGKEKTINCPGYRVDNKTIEITIKNQPFTPTTNEHGTEFNLYYNVNIKGHFGDNWQTYCQTTPQSSSQYTVISGPAAYPEDSQLDFQVEAIVGHLYDALAGRPILPLWQLATDATSGWSNTKTLTIGEATHIVTITPTPAPTIMSTPTVTEMPTQNLNETSVQALTVTDFPFEVDLQDVIILLAVLVPALFAVVFVVRSRMTGVGDETG